MMLNTVVDTYLTGLPGVSIATCTLIEIHYEKFISSLCCYFNQNNLRLVSQGFSNRWPFDVPLDYCTSAICMLAIHTKPYCTTIWNERGIRSSGIGPWMHAMRKTQYYLMLPKVFHAIFPKIIYSCMISDHSFAFLIYSSTCWFFGRMCHNMFWLITVCHQRITLSCWGTSSCSTPIPWHAFEIGPWFHLSIWSESFLELLSISIPHNPVQRTVESLENHISKFLTAVFSIYMLHRYHQMIVNKHTIAFGEVALWDFFTANLHR